MRFERFACTGFGIGARQRFGFGALFGDGAGLGFGLGAFVLRCLAAGLRFRFAARPGLSFRLDLGFHGGA